MSVHVVLPMSLRQFAAGKSTISVDATTVPTALEQVILLHAELRPFLLDDHGQPHGYLNLFVNERTAAPDTELSAGDELLVVSAIAGG